MLLVDNYRQIEEKLAPPHPESAITLEEPPVGAQVMEELEKIEGIAPQILWIQHPSFSKRDLAKLPEFGKRYSRDQLLCYFDDFQVEYNMRKKHRGNTFFRWLNSDEPKIKRVMEADSFEIFSMNCADYVYMNLFNSGLVSKKKIKHIYKSHIKNALSGNVNCKRINYYGFNPTQFVPLDGAQEPKPGDILLGCNRKDIPLHILFYAGRNEQQEFMGNSLWCVGVSRPNPATLSLPELQAAYSRGDPKIKLTFKFCPLEQILCSFESQT